MAGNGALGARVLSNERDATKNSSAEEENLCDRVMTKETTRAKAEVDQIC